MVATFRASNALHVAFGVDEGYFPGAAASMASIIQNNPHTRIAFHVFCFHISEPWRDRMHHLAANHRVSMTIHIVDTALFDGLRHVGEAFHFSARSALLRLVIPPAMAGVTHRILYLDADILCQGSLIHLTSVDLTDSIAAAVPDMGDDPLVDLQCYLFDLERNRYFNAGFLYINVDQWIENDVTPILLDLMRTHNDALVYPDQDALNIALKGRVTLVPERWNFQFNAENALLRGHTMFSPPSDVVLIHFVGRMKPWHGWNMHQCRQMYRRYEVIPSHSDTSSTSPKDADEMFLYAKILLRHGRVIAAACWYVKHWACKLAADRTRTHRYKRIRHRMRLFKASKLERISVESTVPCRPFLEPIDDVIATSSRGHRQR